MAGTWLDPDTRTRWSRESFELETTPLIDAAVERAKQSFQGAIEPANRLLSSFSVPSLETLTAGWTTPSAPASAAAAPDLDTPAARPAMAPWGSEAGPQGMRGRAPSAGPARSAFSVPSLETLTAGWITPPQPREAPSVAPGASEGGLGVSGATSAFSGPPGPSRAPVGSSPAPSASAPTDIAGYIRHAAARRGIDPEVAIRVAESEGGLTDPVRQSDVINRETGRREESYGPFQLYLGGGLGNAAVQRGIDPRNPAHWQAAVDFALDEAARGGWGPWHGAARVGIGNQQGIGTYRGPVPAEPSAQPASRPSPASTPPDGVPTAVADGPGWRQTWGKDLTPHQINETLSLGLSWDAALATCGIAASVAFARANGRAPTFKEALDLAKRTGEWNQDVGMTRGTTGQLALLKGLGVDAEARPLSEQEIASTVTAGTPVQINAHGNGGHFYVAQGYDPQTRKFDFGNSAAILKRAGGNTWFRLDELPGLGVGTPSEAIYIRRRAGG